MNGSDASLAQLVILTGAILAAALAGKAALERLRIPALVGWLGLGLALSGLDAAVPILPEGSHQVVDFLAELGVIVLLFGVGLASDPGGLRRALRSATPVWLGNVLVSGGAGFVAAHWGIGLDWVPSLMAAVALTATSVGVPAAVWERARALRTRDGELFLDVAELDDLSGVIAIAFLFAVLPTLEQAGGEGLVAAFLLSAGRTILVLAGFGVLCAALAAFVTRPLTRILERLEPGPDPVLSVTALGILLAGLAGLLGFSVAIGAFFAGLAFSQASGRFAESTPYAALRDLFVPFFFVGTGLRIEPHALLDGALPAIVLLAAAVAGKLAGTVPLARRVTSRPGAWALGWSMVPRAEIALVIAGFGLQLGDRIMPPELYSALVVVVALSCLAAPPLVARRLEEIRKDR